MVCSEFLECYQCVYEWLHSYDCVTSNPSLCIAHYVFIIGCKIWDIICMNAWSFTNFFITFLNCSHLSYFGASFHVSERAVQYSCHVLPFSNLSHKQKSLYAPCIIVPFPLTLVIVKNPFSFKGRSTYYRIGEWLDHHLKTLLLTWHKARQRENRTRIILWECFCGTCFVVCSHVPLDHHHVTSCLSSTHHTRLCEETLSFQVQERMTRKLFMRKIKYKYVVCSKSSRKLCRTNNNKVLNLSFKCRLIILLCPHMDFPCEIILLVKIRL